MSALTTTVDGHFPLDQTVLSRSPSPSKTHPLFNEMIAKIDAKFDVRQVSDNETTLSFIENNLKTQNDGKPFHVMDLRVIDKLIEKWQVMFPRVDPHYAVKANSDIVLLSTLLAYNVGFDCASQHEIRLALSLGASPDRILFANPTKFHTDLIYAAENGVERMTADNIDELYKIAEVYFSEDRIVKTTPKVIIRIVTDDSTAQCRLSTKFGAEVQDCEYLLQVAQKLNIPIVGVSFHCGSGCNDVGIYADSITNARKIFDLGLEMGHPMHILDIGGGFPGDDNGNVQVTAIANVVTPLVDDIFPQDLTEKYTGVPPLHIVAEPGRYFCHSSMMFATPILARRVTNQLPSYSNACRVDELNNTQAASSSSSSSSQNNTSNTQSLKFQSYNKSVTINTCSTPETYFYIADGVYGAFNSILFDHYTPRYPLILSAKTKNKPLNLLPQIQTSLESYLSPSSSSSSPACPSLVFSPSSSSPSSPNATLFDTTIENVSTTFDVFDKTIPLNTNATDVDADADVVNHDYTELRFAKIFGPTCDGLDTIFYNIPLPTELNINDWLIFPDMGAYTVAAQSSFNGIPRPNIVYIRSGVSS